MIGFEKEFVYPAAATVVALIGACTDIKSRRIPNYLTGMKPSKGSSTLSRSTKPASRQ